MFDRFYIGYLKDTKNSLIYYNQKDRFKRKINIDFKINKTKENDKEDINLSEFEHGFLIFDKKSILLSKDKDRKKVVSGLSYNQVVDCKLKPKILKRTVCFNLKVIKEGISNIQVCLKRSNLNKNYIDFINVKQKTNTKCLISLQRKFKKVLAKVQTKAKINDYFKGHSKEFISKNFKEYRKNNESEKKVKKEKDLKIAEKNKKKGAERSHKEKEKNSKGKKKLSPLNEGKDKQNSTIVNSSSSIQTKNKTSNVTQNTTKTSKTASKNKTNVNKKNFTKKTKDKYNKENIKKNNSSNVQSDKQQTAALIRRINLKSLDSNIKTKEDIYKKYKNYLNQQSLQGTTNQQSQNNFILFASNLTLTLKEDKEDDTPDDEEEKHKKIVDYCNKDDIYCLCKHHPDYKNCVCGAFPKSIICNKNFCKEHFDEYECKPKSCDLEFSDSEKCYCKNNIDDLKCKCRLNPYSEECFCLQYPSSHLCNKRICQFNPNSIFCACRSNLREDICAPGYCVEHPLDAYCKCISSPGIDECRCLNDPTSCENKNQFMEAIVEYDLKIRDACINNKLFYSIDPNSGKTTNHVVYDNSIDPTLVDPLLIYNMYYPPCIYNTKKSNSKDTPCIPFPQLKKPSKKNLLSKGKVQGMKCFGAVEKKTSRLHVNSKLNGLNFINLKKVDRVRNNKELIMLYQKFLMFNNKFNKNLMS